MIGGNAFTSDILSNASSIRKIIDSANDFLHHDAHLIETANRRQKRTDISNHLTEASVRCENIYRMSKQMEVSAQDVLNSLIQNCLSLLLQKITLDCRPIVCVLAPMFTEHNIADGYMKRIKNIDELIPSLAFRMYVYCDPCTPWPTLELIDEDHAVFTYNDTQDAEEPFSLISAYSSFIYCHSIYRFDQQLLKNCGKEVILDFHGAVPEEISCLTGDVDKARLFSIIEQQAIMKASTIIAVTESMVDHIKEKYPRESRASQFVVMPIFDANIQISKIERESKTNHGHKPRIVYAGGTQKWQLIDEMIDAAAEQPSIGSYAFFTPDPEFINTLWGERVKPNDLTISTKSPEELSNEYRESDFGFVLRDESVLNRVACPTKLVEYLVHGIIPILKNPLIGDFAKDGLAYVTLNDFRKGRLPSSNESQKMRETNYRVISHQMKRFECGKSTTVRLFHNLLANEGSILHLG